MTWHGNCYWKPSKLGTMLDCSIRHQAFLPSHRFRSKCGAGSMPGPVQFSLQFPRLCNLTCRFRLQSHLRHFYVCSCGPPSLSPGFDAVSSTSFPKQTSLLPHVDLICYFPASN